MKIEMTKVLEYLKPKVKALGFKKEVLEGIAADVADNLKEVDDDASDEDINAVIAPAVDAVIPSLKLAQRLTNQGIEEFRKKFEKANEPKNEPEPKKEPSNEPKNEPEPKKEPSSTITPEPKKSEEIPAWAQTLIDQNKQSAATIAELQAELKGIKTKSVAEVRKAKLQELLKDTGAYGESVLKRFKRMVFETDEEFEDYFNEEKENLEQLNQERANEGLDKFGVPKVDPAKQEPQKPKVLNDAEMEELAANL